jgi:DNA transformation protein
MRRQDEFAAHAAEVLSTVGTVATRRMFGGYGLYCDGVMFALIADNVLYLKADPGNRADFERAGCTPFVYGTARRRTVLSYSRAPDEVLESREAAGVWARSALAAALRARAATRRRPQSRTPPSTAGGRRLTRSR